MNRERRKRDRTSDDGTIAQWRHILHRLWTQNVGQPGYDKKSWYELEQEINKAIKEARAK